MNTSAATIAAALAADIVGLFVQEESLLRLAGLSSATALTGTGATATAMTPQLMHARMEQLARTYQRSLSTEADEAPIKWSFQTKSGELLNSIKSALQAGDYLVVPCEAARHDFLHLQKLIAEVSDELNGVVVTPAYTSSSNQYPLAVLIDRDTGLDRMLDLASSLARHYRSSINLLIAAGSQEKFTQLDAAATGMLANDISVTTYQLSLEDPVLFAAAMRQINPAYMIANIKSSLTRSNDVLASVYIAAKAPLVLLR